jgi:catechol 2,3-dioxygenase-like lactoylglutathione lyase family enzyme
MITGVHHIGVSVANIAATRSALGAALTLDDARSFEAKNSAAVQALFQLPDVDASVSLLRGPNVFLELFDFRAPAPAPSRWRAPNESGITHICIQSRKGDDVAQRCTAAGIDFFAPMTGLGGDYRYAYGRAQELMIEVEDAAYAPTDPSTWIGHVAFATSDLERLARFYADLVGAEPEFSPRLRGHRALDVVTGLKDVDVRAAWVHGLNIGLEFWCYSNPPTGKRLDRRPINEAGYSHVCFETVDMEAAFARALALGAAPHAEPQILGGAVAAYLRDPDGNIVELLQWRDAGARLSLASAPHLDVLTRMKAARAAHHQEQAAQ